MSLYEFMDTTEYKNVKIRSAESVSIDGIYLEDALSGFRILNVTGRELLPRTVETRQIGNKIGEEYIQSHYDSRTITIRYQITASSAYKYREIFNQLNGYLSGEQIQVVFWDESDKYYIGTKASNDEVEAGRNSIIGEIEIYCPDPRKYATTLKEFTASPNSDGQLEMTVTNDGTAAVPISYTITHNAENGYIGIVGADGIIQIGNIDETDDESYTQSETLLTTSSYKAFNDSGWYTDTGKNGYDSSIDVSGSLHTVTVNSNKVLSLNSKGSGSTTGGQWSFDIVDSNGDEGAVNFYVYHNSWFAKGLPTQTGIQIISCVDSSNNLVMAQVIKSTDKSGGNADVSFYVGNGSGGVTLYKTISFTASTNPSANGYLEDTGHADMQKEGKSIRFYWYNNYYTTSVSALKSVKVAKVQLFIGNYKSGGDNMTRNYFRRVSFKISGVEKWRDVKNRYQPGDVIYVDGDKAKILVNDMPKQDEEVTGSYYFLAPSGETTIQFAYSSWCATAPTIKASIREAWL